MIKQYWNPRSRKWVKIDTSKSGGIMGMQEEKFEGVPETESSSQKSEQNKDLDSDQNNENDGWMW